MVELSPAGAGLLRQGFAGDALNTAVYLKRARPQVEVRFLTVTGADPLSEAMRAAWRADGVDDGLAFTDAARRPALYLIETDAGGDRRFHYWRGESAARGWLRALIEAGGADVLAGADLIYLSGISLAILTPDDRAAALSLLSGLKGARIAYDPNLRPALWPSLDDARQTFEAMAGIARILLPSRDDLESLYGESHDPRPLLRTLAGLGAGEIAMTGAGGDCWVVSGEGMQPLRPPMAVPVDTSGGGDSFNGAYLAARLAGLGPAEAARAGLDLAARVVEHRGALVRL